MSSIGPGLSKQQILAIVGTVIGVAGGAMAYDSGLVSLTAADETAGLPYVTADDTWSRTDLSAFARTVLDDADATTFRTTINALRSPSGMPAQGDTLYYGGSTWDRLGPGSAGQVLTTGGAGANPAWADAVTPAPVLYGTGKDGACNLDGTNTFTWASKSGSTYTATADPFCTTITVRNGVTLKPSGFSIYGSVECITESGAVVHDDGNAASGTTFGAALGAAGTLGRVSGQGAGGRSSDGVGSNGGSTTSSYGGQGGAGGSGGGNGGGVAGSVTAPASNVTAIYTPIGLLTGRPISASSFSAYNGGSGGGGGGLGLNGGTGGSGAGGSGGGYLRANCKRWTNNGIWRAKGGAGSAATSSAGSPNGGGGGGGGGGVILVTTDDNNVEGTLDVSGGAGGAGVGTGTAGNNGSSGLALVVDPA